AAHLQSSRHLVGGLCLALIAKHRPLFSWRLLGAQQRRPDYLHAVSLEPTWVVYLSVRLAGLLEEAFNPRRRGEGKQHPPGLLAEVSPHVRDVSWGQNRIAGFQPQLRFADLHQHFVATFDEVKPFLLLVVN